MGLFEFFKKQNKDEQPFLNNDNPVNDEIIGDDSLPENVVVEDGKNTPCLLTAKLFFEETPVLDEAGLYNKIKAKYPGASFQKGDGIMVFTLPNPQGAHRGKFQCCLLTSNDLRIQPLPQEAFQQNWHWKEAGNVTRRCKYEVLLAEQTINNQDYKTRTAVFIDFVTSCILVTNPLVVYSKNAEKLLDPQDYISCNSSVDPDFLYPLSNIRMFKMAESPTNEIIMDTIGLGAFGLPDFELVVDHYNPAKVAELLLRYCYFIFDIGDNILHGEYVEGLDPSTKWQCEKRLSILPPQRVVLHVIPD